MKIRKMLLLTGLALVHSMALAENVSVKSCTTLANNRGEVIGSEDPLPLVFQGVVFGGECGSRQASYNKGERWNNLLDAQMKCTVSAVLKRRGGRVMRNTKVIIKNDALMTRASGRTNSRGRISFQFSTLVGGPDSYALIGPSIPGLGKVACVFYRYDHMV